jgi:SAM-dependent methyltransferase
VSRRNSLGYKSTQPRDVGGYSRLAAEYYDAAAHPTCADFRTACRIYLERLFRDECPKGVIADIGCGQSLIAELILRADVTQGARLVLVDSSEEMLRANRISDAEWIEARLIDIEREAFGLSEFDWAFAVLGDPYNSLAAWKNISTALREGGECVFIVPSHVWVQSFRLGERDERPDFARFVTREGEDVYLRSIVRDRVDQRKLITMVGLEFTQLDTVSVAELPFASSPKIHRFLHPSDPVIEVYRSKKEFG